jgi:glutamate synthase (NADPH/NADH) small chain
MVPRDLAVEGRSLKGVHFAMDFLTQQNRVVAGKNFENGDRILATGKNVLVIGGGDTGSDCVGTSIRQNAANVKQIEILPKPPEERNENNPWPYWANILRSSSSHHEGCEREWLLNTTKIIGNKEGNVTGVEIVTIDWVKENGQFKMIEKADTKKIVKAELVLLSMGFVHCIHDGLASELGLEKDMRGNIKVNTKGQTNVEKVFASGDAVSGASLVVRAISSGRKAAENVQAFLSK